VVERKKQRAPDDGLNGWVGSSGSEDDSDSELDGFVVDDDHISYSSAEEDELDRVERRLLNKSVNFTIEEDSCSLRVESDSEVSL
jgi:hypothetical protein